MKSRNVFLIALMAILGLCASGEPLLADSTVVLNEIMYHPVSNEAEMEWLELHNQMGVDMDISGWSIADGVLFVFPEGTIIPGGGFIVVAASPDGLEAAGVFTGALGPFEGRLDNGGERVELWNNSQRLMDRVSYRDRGGWSTGPDGSGVSLAKIDAGTASQPARNWTFSREMGGTPGEQNFPSGSGGLEVPPGIVSYWSFDGTGGTVRDAYGDNDGTFGTGTSRTDGLVGSGALSFDNTPEAFVDVDGGAQNNFATTTGITLEVVLEPSWSGALDDQDHIFRKQDGTRRIVLAFQHDAEEADRDVPIVPAAQPVLSFGINVGGNYSELDMPLDGQEGRPSLESLKDGSAHHVAATYDSATGLKAIYVDGELAFSASFEPETAMESGGAATAFIGNMSGRGHPFTGVLDEVAFWSRALTAEEVAAHFANVQMGQSYFEADEIDATSGPPLAFNETLVSAEESWVEIANFGPAVVQLEGAILVTSAGDGGEYVFPEQSLPAGEFLALTPETLGFELAEDDKMFLYTPDRSALVDAVLLEDGIRGRHPDGTGPWLRPSEPTPGAANEFELHDEIVINEILYHPRPILESPGRFEDRIIVPVDVEWRFDQSGEELGTAWREVEFNDDDWASGKGLFFSENSDLGAPKNTPLELGPITYYFRTEFEIEGDPGAINWNIGPFVDDGVVFYVNGVEVGRMNMPEGEIDSTTTASRSVGNADFGDPIPLAGDHLVTGTNVLAAEVHQVRASSNDVVFGARIFETLTLEEPVEYSERAESWLELYNRGTDQVDLTGWQLDQGVRYTFEEGTAIPAGAYLVVAEDKELLRLGHPGLPAVGNFEGRLSDRTDRIRLLDANGNPADEVRYYDRGPWPSYADGYGSSIELRDPNADNSKGEMWAASDESQDSEWVTYSFRGRPTQVIGPGNWSEFVFGLFDEGEVLLDDISVIDNPGDDGTQLIQDGSFDEEDGATWRFLGTHANARVIDDPAAGQVLHLIATGSTEHMHNHVETTYANRARITGARDVEVSFKARWLGGSSQLHTRLYFNRLPHTTILKVPDRGGGTPGEQNSRLVVNAGPTLRDFGHQPLYPGVGEDVTVAVIAEDPDGVKACTVWWSVDSGDWSSAPMTGDGDGLYRGTIPGQDSESAVVQFYVEAEDTRGAIEIFPARGPESGAVFKPADSAARPGIAHNLRILVTPEVSELLHRNTNRMSNAKVPATVIYREREVFYDVGVRLRGSERGRPDETRTGFLISFNPDRLFRGVHRSVSIDPSGGWSGRVPFGSQDEILVKHIAQHAGGIPGMYDDLVYVIAPRRPQTGYALLLMARFGREFLETQFEDGNDGTAYTYELVYSPNTTTNGDPESLKRPLPDSVVGTDHRDLGDDKEQYRWIYLIENNVRRDDYSTIMKFAKTLGLSGAALDAASQEVMDVDQWMRAFAMYSLTGIGDTYMSGNFHNNMYYVRPSDGKVLVFPWDMDFAFVAGAGAPLWGPHNFRKVIEIPRNTRRFFVHLQDIIATTFNREYMEHWTTHYGQATGVNFGGFLTDIEGRRRNVLNRIPREVPFEIRTNDGENFTVDTTEVEIRGTAWIDVNSILLAGVEAQPALTWLGPATNPVNWEMTVPLETGANELNFLAIDAAGELISSASITVTSVIDQPPPAMFIRGDANLDGSVNITDATGILSHLFVGVLLPCEDALDVNDDEELNLVDAVQLLNFLFGDGEPPAAPYPLPGVDSDENGALGCEMGLEVE